jgi:hypothetical protein
LSFHRIISTFISAIVTKLFPHNGEIAKKKDLDFKFEALFYSKAPFEKQTKEKNAINKILNNDDIEYHFFIIFLFYFISFREPVGNTKAKGKIRIHHRT